MRYLAFFLLAISLTACGGREQRSDPPAPEKQEAKDIPGVPQENRVAGDLERPVPIHDLHDQHAVNEVAFDDRYKGKTILVRGIMLTVRSTPAIILGEPDYPLLAPARGLCLLKPSEKQKAGKLTPYHNVAVRGRCDGARDGLIVLSDCEIVQISTYVPPKIHGDKPAVIIGEPKP